MGSIIVVMYLKNGISQSISINWNNRCKEPIFNCFFSYSGIALLEQFCDEGINLQNPTDDQNHQVTVSTF